MIRVRKSDERGKANHGWLNSKHTFSFASYFDPKFGGFGQLRVLNEDLVKGGEGFPTHPHGDFEIFSYVVNGGLRHKDSMGNEEIIKRGQVQFTSAGSGIAHSEYNASETDRVHFLQLWVKPWKNGLSPAYHTKDFPDEVKRNNLVCFVAKKGSKEAGAAAIPINQDFYGLATLLEPGRRVTYTPADPTRKIYLHVVQEGASSLKVVTPGGEAVLYPGDGAFIEGASTLTLEGGGAPGQAVEALVLDSA